MKTAAKNDQKIFFIFVGYYIELRDFLIQSGFVEGRDFINGMILLPTTQNINFFTYPLIREM